MGAVQDNIIPEFIHRTNTRSRSVRIGISNAGEVIVTTPPHFPTSRVLPFLQKSQDWIEKHLILHKRRLEVGGENSVLYFGDALKIVIEREHYDISKNAIRVIDDTIIIVPVALTAESVAKALIRWLKAEAERHIVPRIENIAKTYGHTYSSIHLRDQTSRWGSCSTHGNLQLNWRLIQAPKEVIDYVIMHELAHLKHMDHSPRFWAYVEKLDPHYTDHKRWLRLHGAALHQDFKFDPKTGDSI